jgi:hypothetical protein
MYKLTSERTNFLARTASHSTKPSRREKPGWFWDADRAEAEIAQLDLQDAVAFREGLLVRLQRLNKIFDGLGDRERHSGHGREKTGVQLNLTLVNRHIKTLRRTAEVLDHNDQWRLAAKLTLSLPDIAKLEAYRSAIQRFTRRHGYPPNEVQQIEEMLLTEQIERERERANVPS